MSQNVLLSQGADTTQKLGSLFKDSKNEPNFFDTFESTTAAGAGAATASAEESENHVQPTETSLPRHSSELFLASHCTEEDSLSHSVSQGDLNAIAGFKNPLIGEHVLQGTESMQSIKLSQESLDEEKLQFVASAPTFTEVPTEASSENIAINTELIVSSEQQTAPTVNNVETELQQNTSDTDAVNTQKQWHPLEVPNVDSELKNEGIDSTLQDHPNSFVNSAMSYEQPATDCQEANNVFTINEVLINQVCTLFILNAASSFAL